MTKTKKPKPNKSNELADATFSALAAKVIEAMEQNPGNWSKSWAQQASTGLPINATTGAAYKGGNVMWLIATAWENAYTTNQWATFKQWKEFGYGVQKGEKSTVAIFFKPILVDDGDKVDENGNQAKRRIWIKNAFRVFNRAQVAPIEGEEQKPLHGDEEPESLITNENETIEHAEDFFNALGFEIRGGSPAYSPIHDFVMMPPLADFDSSEDYYATLAHEATHWTGHKSRLNRIAHKSWGDESYAFEELVAELGAVFLSAGVLGITPEPRPDHAQYLASWIKRIKADPSAIWTAATKAEHAVRFMVEAQEKEEVMA